MFRVLMTAGLLFAVVKFRQPCGQAVSQFVAGFDEPAVSPPAATIAVPPAGKPVVGPGGEAFVEITPGMTDADIEKAFQELKAQAAARKAGGEAGATAPTP